MKRRVCGEEREKRGSKVQDCNAQLADISHDLPSLSI